jgi:ribosomal protein S18 acetylase RimI-like enzyme
MVSLIRKADVDDIDAIAEIEKRSFPGLTAYSKRQLRYLVLKANSTSLVETDGFAIHGFIIVTYRKGSRIGSLETIAIDPQFRRRGISRKLLLAGEEDMKQRRMKFAQLEVSEKNRPAINLYRNAGYVVKQRLVGFYQFEHKGTRNAVRMVKTLDQAH